MIDLRTKPFVRDKTLWCSQDDYGACQSLARSAREGGTRIVCYESVREPEHGGCAAVLDYRAFLGNGGVRQRQTWFLTVDRRRASWVRAGTRREQAHEFIFDLDR